MKINTPKGPRNIQHPHDQPPPGDPPPEVQKLRKQARQQAEDMDLDELKERVEDLDEYTPDSPEQARKMEIRLEQWKIVLEERTLLQES